MWPWPDGPRGPTALHTIIERESALIRSLADGASPERHPQHLRVAVPGGIRIDRAFDELMRRKQDPSTLPGTDGLMRAFVTSNWDILVTAVYGLRLFAMRFGVLILAVPLFAVTAIAALADGIVAWYLRRSGGGRDFRVHLSPCEAGDVAPVHRAMDRDLIPPVVVDPRLVIAPALLMFGAFMRTVVGWLEKLHLIAAIRPVGNCLASNSGSGAAGENR